MHVLAVITPSFLLSFTTLSYSQFYLLIQRRKHLSSQFWSYSETSPLALREDLLLARPLKIGTEILSNTYTAHIRDYLGIYNSKRRKKKVRGKISSRRSKY